jgi:hypothetical protein
MTTRAAWLARPWFFIAIGLLFLNDHVFKAASPGLLTGKLSDLAGLVVVATLASVLVGPRTGVVLAGLAFVALKTTPGVAEVVAPLMGGGIIVRDPSDLIALAVLPVLWRTLTRDRPDQRVRNTRGWAAIGLVAAVLATTADTTPVPPQVDHVWFDNGTFYAQVDRYSVPFSSHDGGRTWRRIQAFPSPVLDSVQDAAGGVCALDNTCYRKLRAGGEGADASTWKVIERRTGGGDWTEDYRFAEGEWARDIALDPSDSSRVVVAYDAFVMRRTSTGAWESANLVEAAAGSDGIRTTVVADTPKWQRDLVRALGVPATAIALGVLSSVLIWFLVPWWGVKAVFAFGNLIGCGFLYEVAQISSPMATVKLDVTWLAVIALLAGVMRVGWWLERRRRVTVPAEEQPPEDLR